MHGALKAGGKFDVLYDSARLAKHAEVTAEMKFAKNGHVFSKKLSGIVSIGKVTTYGLTSIQWSTFASKQKA